VQRISNIVNAMKVFSHPGNEGRASVDLNQALETTLLVAKNEWKYVAETELDLDPELPRVVCYPGEMNQVFLNLVVNAAHAIGDVVGTSGQKGWIRIQTRCQGDWVEIRVTDTGTGIPEKIHSQIFLPFFTTKVVGRGTGQGLSIVHSVVAKHGGSVDFETTMGQGTTFIVKLPIKGA
jgi:signal transduction histidine kinase